MSPYNLPEYAKVSYVATERLSNAEQESIGKLGKGRAKLLQ